MTTAATATDAPPPWYAAYPAARSTPDKIASQELWALMKSGAVAGKDYLLVDLRRTDNEGGTIAGSINLPAQSLYPTIPTLYTMAKAAGVWQVVWYCGSSRGRGSRAAAWFADHIKEQGGEAAVKSVILEGGIAGWVAGGERFVELMLEYEPSAWVEG